MWRQQPLLTPQKAWLPKRCNYRLWLESKYRAVKIAHQEASPGHTTSPPATSAGP